jgi:hypothetical protein
MTGPPLYPDSGQRTDGEARLPRWVKIVGITAAILVLLVVILMLLPGGGSGGHGPSRHGLVGDAGGLTLTEGGRR